MIVNKIIVKIIIIITDLIMIIIVFVAVMIVILCFLPFLYMQGIDPLISIYSGCTVMVMFTVRIAVFIYVYD